MSDIEQRLRSLAKAYPEDIFTPLTDSEREEHSRIISLASAAMGRHFASVFIEAADHIAELQRQLAEARTVIQHEHGRISIGEFRADSECMCVWCEPLEVGNE